MTFLGYDVLTLDYNRAGSIAERAQRKFVLLDAKTGKRTPDEQSPAPAWIRPITWTAIGRPAETELRDFLDARKGRAVPFWLPSIQWDLTLMEDLNEDAAIATIQWVRYTQQMFGTTGARRHVALWPLGNALAPDCYQITDADDPLDYVTESITLDPVAVQDYPAATTVISFLKLCRLDADEVTVVYKSGNIAEATFPLRELPMEAPL
jgi:hypothetical protein